MAPPKVAEPRAVAMVRASVIVDMASFQPTQDEAALTVVAMARGSSVWERAGEAGNRLLAVLPDTVVLRAAQWRSPTAYRSSLSSST